MRTKQIVLVGFLLATLIGVQSASANDWSLGKLNPFAKEEVKPPAPRRTTIGADRGYRYQSRAPEPSAWEKFDEYELGTNFRAWASRIAYFKVLEHRRAAGADRIVFSAELVEAIDKTLEEESPLLELRREALRGCVEKLSPQDRQLIELRYEPEATVAQVAETVGRSNDAIYKAVSRIHGSLFDCIERALRQEGHR